VIPHNRPSLGAQERAAAERAIASGWLARGPECAALESELAATIGIPAEHVVLTSSGSSALFLALWALGASGKRVGISGYACAALRNAAALAGASHRVLDVAPDSPNLAPDDAAGDCDIVVAPHMYGIPLDVRPLAARTAVVEDCAQALGARQHVRHVGLDGAIAICSFYATKLLTTGGHGGAVFSRERAPIDAIRDYLDFDCRRDAQPRFNFEITDLQAAVGRAQLARFPEFLERREAIFTAYRNAGARLLEPPPGATAVRYRAVVRTPRPGALIGALESAGIRAIVPIEDWELLAPSLPNATALSRETVSLPVYPELGDDAVRAICRVVEEHRP
jgi:perosamine synthetase